MYVLNYWKGCLTAFNLYLFFLVGHYLWGFFFPSLSLYYSSQWFSVCGPKTSSISISTVESLSEIHILRPYPRLLNQKLLVHAKTWEPIRFQPLIWRVIATRAAKGIRMPPCSWWNHAQLFKIPSSWPHVSLGQFSSFVTL